MALSAQQIQVAALVLGAFLKERDDGKEADGADEARKEEAGLLIPESRDDTIARLAADGRSFGEIGREVSLPPGAVANILKRLQKERDIADVS